MTHAEFVAWHARMGYTYDTGAAALGLSRSAYANFISGAHRDTGKLVQYDLRTALACAALEAGLAPLGE